MRAPLSVIIPTLDAAQALPETLAFLMEGVASGLLRELIVSDGGSKDDTIEIATQAGALVIAGSPGRGGQVRRGCDAATGPWLLVLHADTHLSDGWSRVVAEHLAQDGLKAGYFRLRFRASGLAPRVVAAGANLRSRLFGLPYGDQGLVIPRHLLERAGGYPDLPLMEDVVLARRLKGSLIGLDAVAATGAERYERNGWIRQSVANFVRLVRFGFGAKPADIARGYD